MHGVVSSVSTGVFSATGIESKHKSWNQNLRTAWLHFATGDVYDVPIGTSFFRRLRDLKRLPKLVL